MKSGTKVHLLTYEAQDLEDYLLGIHTDLEAFQIAFSLNKFCEAKFARI